ncbi:MAG TPA: PaaI family thioesterase [Thermoanaerobaculia bacterium]|nr:PaaI family thioesterase [Thermoanaerobaculia bacterium]
MTKLSELVRKWQAGEVELAPITTLLEVRPVSIGEGEARVELTATSRLHNNLGTVHGGVFCDIADMAMGVALASVAEEGEFFITLQMQMSYFLPVVEGRLSAHARVIRRGRTSAHMECDLEDGEDRLVARATCVYAMRRQER